MLDVHPPSEAAHSWRDFTIHIATIVIGLLIAIGLEQAVELLHHRHIVREARENIRREIEVNQKQTVEDIGYVKADAARMKTNVAALGELLKDPKRHSSMSFQFTWSSFNDSAWRSARDSGALIYMPVTEVQAYADCYAQQELVNKQAVEVFTHQAELTAPLMLSDADQPSDLADLQTVRHETAIAYVRLVGLGQLIDELQSEYAETLRK